MRFIARRLLHGCILLLGVSFLAFVFLQLAPGSFIDEMRLNPQISRETIAAIYIQYGLDKPLPVRYLTWLWSVVRCEWGMSLAYNAPVAPLLIVRSRNTLVLTGTATLLTWLAALPLGVLIAAKGRRLQWLDHAENTITTLLLITPDLLLALGFLWVAVHTHLFPSGGMRSLQSTDEGAWSHWKDVASHLIAPVAVLLLGGMPLLLRHIRTAMAEALGSPYVRAARAHGISHARILFRHALPAAAVPLISLFGLSVGSLLSSSLLVEVIMNWPGLGPLLLEAILARDVYVVIGSVVFSAVFLIGGTLLADVLLFLADPRIRQEHLT